MNAFFLGALALASFIVGLFFLRFYTDTKDRLFLGFGVAFWLLGLQWTLVFLIDPLLENRPYVYLFRLAAFLLIFISIVDKNRRD